MKITTTQLRRIIKEELEAVNEAVDFGAALSAGSLAGVGRASIVAALSALSDADFKKLELALRDAGFAREDSKRSGAIVAVAGKMTPASISKKINASLSSYNWSWAGEYDSDKRDAVNAVLDSTLGAGTGKKFDDALYYYNATDKSDAFRKMSRAEADRKYKSAMETLARIAGDLAMA
jgi:hypothetical protein